MRKAIVFFVALAIGQVAMAAQGPNAHALASLKSRLNLTAEPSQTEYVKKIGETPSGAKCVLTLENSADRLNVTITTDSFDSDFASFLLTATETNKFGDKVTNVDYRDVGMMIVVKSDVETNASLRASTQALQISINTSTSYKITNGQRSSVCSISNMR